MSVLIKGMEMPTDCHNCPLGFGGGCYCGTSADEYMCPDHGRSEWCPLVLVPPHGRLIDADALRQSMYHEAFETDSPMQKWDSGCWIRYKMFERLEENAPTIIPPSGGKEDE